MAALTGVVALPSLPSTKEGVLRTAIGGNALGRLLGLAVATVDTIMLKILLRLFTTSYPFS
ncbi:hypothetical protein TYRP_014089 [Tyrophagus putrescentiae]|nr:hypothetical protein TYRP_014089 [Tyrophagus putrescentiae]